MPKKKPQLVYYMSKDCPACANVTPSLKELTQMHGVPLKTVEVNPCPKDDKYCNTKIKWVPTIALCDDKGCKEIKLERVPEAVKKLGGNK